MLAVLSWGSRFNKAIIQAAIANPGKKPVVFLYLGERISGRKPEMFRLIEPHLNDEQARQDLGRANFEAQQAGIECRFVYRRQEAGALLRVWQELHPRDIIIAAEQLPELEDVHAQRIRDEAIDGGQVMHLLAAPLPA